MASSRIKGITIEIGGNTTKLQTALKGVDSSLKKTQSNLRDINNLLKLDPKNVELLTQKQKNLTKAVEDYKKKLDQLKAAQSQVSEGTEEWDALQREIVSTEQYLKDAEAAAKDFGSVAKQQFKAVGDQIKSAGTKVSDFGKKLAPISGAAAALGGGLIKLGYDAVTSADELNTLSNQTGISTDELQKMSYAADLVDVSVDDITGALRRMKKNMDPSNEAFKKLGVQVTNADGSMRDAVDVFYDSIEALSQISNETERDQAAMDLFGRSADDLAGIIDDGGESLRLYGDEAENLGLVLSEDTLTALNETNDTIDQLKATISGTLGQIGADVAEVLAPALEELAGYIGGVTAKLRELDPEQTALILKIIGVVAAIGPAIIVIGKLITGIGSIISVLGAVVGVLGGPVTLAIAGVIAAGVALYTNWDTIKQNCIEFGQKVAQKWNELKEDVVDAVNTLKAKVTQQWEALKTGVTNAATAVKTAVVDRFTNIKTSITEKLTAAKTTALNVFTSIKNGIKDKIEAARDFVSNAINKIKGFFNFSWSLPHIKLPHFSIQGEFSLMPPSIPHIGVEWYRKAYETPWLFTTPTIVNGRGFGDGNGGEIVYGRDQLMRDIAQVSTGNTTINVYAPEGMDINTLAQKIEQKLVFNQNMRARAYA